MIYFIVYPAHRADEVPLGAELSYIANLSGDLTGQPPAQEQDPEPDSDSAPAPAAEPSAAAVAVPTASTVLVNGENIVYDAYNIGGSNYFKLRDLAFTLSGTEKQFEVKWVEEADSIMLIGEMPYTVLGGEMVDKGTGEKSASPTTSSIIYSEKLISF
ncbi:MAG: hypothetical protein FWH01_04445 [Oscillospiraceae bacterium]|nr:hypothetical protein [Oscillospiraceae bacterium]